MFRGILSSFLIITITLSSFSRFFIYAGFELNRDLISSTLCENREMPELNCNGQCYLAKKIKQAEEKEKSSKDELKKGHYQEAFLTEKVVLTVPFRFVLDRFSSEIPFNLPLQSSSIFHPPKV